MLPNARGELGEVGIQPLVELAQKVRDIGKTAEAGEGSGWARVGAVAERDTLAASPLLLRFYVVPDAQAADAR